jgi:dolichol kinase
MQKELLKNTKEIKNSGEKEIMMNSINGNFQENGRKILHILIGIFAILMVVYNIFTPLVIFILLIIFIFFSLFSLKYRIPVAYFFLSRFERDREMHELPGRGFLFAILGVLLSLQLFERDVALASVIILTFADPVSYFVGKNFGKTRHFLDSRKNIEGNIAGFIVSSAFALFFVSPLLAIGGSLIAMLFEAVIIEIQKIEVDDNLIVPLAAGTTMFLIKTFLM